MNRCRKQHTILIVDDETTLRKVLSREIGKMGYGTLQAETGDVGLKMLASQEVSVVLLDLKMPGRPSMSVLSEIKDRWPLIEVIILTGHGTVETAIQAMKVGAYDYQQKPCHLDKLEALIGKAIDKQNLVERAQVLLGSGGDGPIEWGHSDALQRVRHDLQKVAPTDAPVLILGESGTGKELIARELHRCSQVSTGSFVVVNGGAIPPSLAESTLFGHERGAFTGAHQRKLGMVELADGGTLFLDELGELTIGCQAKLLRFLQFGETLRVGATEPFHVNARIVGATHVDLDKAVQSGDFREDLLYRLETVCLELPPLRTRKSDIPLLVQRFLGEMVRKGRPERSFSQDAMQFLETYSWPGNVRELRNFVERLSILCDTEVITRGDVVERLSRNRRRRTDSFELMTFREMERRLIILALKRFQGDKPAVAESLGIGLKTLYNKIKSYEVGDTELNQ
jgi:two-component system, NtrC family, response regulator AtoC